MATSQSINAPVNEVAQFDDVATQIMNTYNLLIDQLIARRDALLIKLREMKEDYLTKERTRKAAIEELAKTQQQMGEFSLKVNENKDLHQEATDLYLQRIKQLDTPTKLLQPFFSCPTLYKLQTHIAEFGEVKECVNYSLKKEPILAVGKRGSANDELDAEGLALDEPNQLIYIADCENSRIQVVSFEGNFLTSFGSTILSGPCNVEVTEDFVFVTDKYLNALLKFSMKDYKFLRRTGTEGAREGELYQPYGLCIDYNKDVYVAHSTRVSIFSQGLTLLKYFGTQQLIILEM
ncbi:NHL repeat containing protein [Oopsacas minuta]|uniref:NHL repeat containing protein n=1 Tax=Oopsacas minuta TaxID=111878 RepID=A0AAV7K9Y7_9METZ|nr:NHL repeat containing protein [Oopsacas minuta]